MKNKNLKKFYDTVYKKGENKHYTPFLFSGDKIPPAKAEVLKTLSWKGKSVLDAGCGTGELAFLIAKKGARRVLGVDYSDDAIRVAEVSRRHPALSFTKKEIGAIDEKFDIIVSLGTLEHMDYPFGALKKLKSLLKPNGSLVITCPNWTNPRGYVLLALKFLFDAKITLADIHYFTPLEFKEWAKKLKMKLSWRTIDHDWASGERLLKDFNRRLPNVLLGNKRFATNQKKIQRFIAWLEKHLSVIKDGNPQGGAVGLYHFKK